MQDLQNVATAVRAICRRHNASFLVAEQVDGCLLCTVKGGISQPMLKRLTALADGSDLHLHVAGGDLTFMPESVGGPKSRLARRLDLLFEQPDLANQASLAGLGQEPTPKDMFMKLHRAMAEMGLLDKLRASGVNNKLSDDKQVIHFFVKDSDNISREIAAYELLELAKGSNLEKALKDLYDIANGRAPGTLERSVQHVKDAEQIVRGVAKRNAIDQAGQ